MIYFDNAATGGFKPPAVLSAAYNTLKYLSVNPGRSENRLTETANNFIYSARAEISSLFKLGNPSRVVFTKNCTEALNIALFGLGLKGEVVTTFREHNSVLRPLYELERRGYITLKFAEGEGTALTANDVLNALSENTRAVVIGHVSNLTGEELFLEQLGKELHSRDILFILDAAQSAGHIPIDMQEMNIDVLCAPGHKGLCGIAGSGVLLLSERANPKPLLFGGTGTDSFNKGQPNFYPEALEAGTINLPAVCALLEGARFVERNIYDFMDILEKMTMYALSGLGKIEGVKLYSAPNKSGIVAFMTDCGISSNEIAELLARKYDIAVRGGYHCAPLMHEKLKTTEKGLIRASFAFNNTVREINALFSAVSEIVRNCRKS